jgi:hypothetical protein
VWVAASIALAACAAEAPTISDVERGDLAFVREEEKLARDVYLAIADVGGQSFDNVASSEQTHMDRVGDLLDTYGVPDPSLGEAGRFTNAELGALYGALVARGKASRPAALAVGCEIEELDLHDLEAIRARSSREDVRTSLDELMRGSRNHLRAFYGQLRASGGTYVPEHVEQATFDAIVASAQESGNGR